MKQLSDYNFFSPEVLKCPYEFYKLARLSAPVLELSEKIGEAKIFIVSRYDLVISVIKNVEVFKSDFASLLRGKEGDTPEIQEIMEQGWPQVNTLLTADPPEHERFRALVNKAFTAYRVNKMQDNIQLIVDELIDSFIEKGECEFVSEFAVPLPIRVIATELGVPKQDLPKLKKWSDSFIARLGRTLSKEQQIECAKDIVAFQHYFYNVINQRRKQPSDDIISDLVQADVAGERELDTAEILNIIQQLLVAGNETLTNALAGGILLLIQNPNQMKLVQKDLRLVENLVEEILRLVTPTAGMWRIAKSDTELEGVKIPRGSLVMIRFDSANRDSKIFDEAEDLDVSRSNAINHLAFGHGIHFCIGAALARQEMRIAINRLLLKLKNIRLAPIENNFENIPNLLLREIKYLHIRFEKG